MSTTVSTLPRDQKVKPALFGQAIVKDAILKLGGRATPEELYDYLAKHYSGHSIVKTRGRAIRGLLNRCEIEKLYFGPKYSGQFVYVLKEQA